MKMHTDGSTNRMQGPEGKPRRNGLQSNGESKRALKIAGVYALCGLLWIVLSDRLLAAVVRDSGLLTRFQTFKGWAFIVFTALLVFLLSRRALREPERLAAEAQASEARFRALFENVNVVALVVDPLSGGILDANEAAATFYGWSREQLRSMNIAAINTLPRGEIRERINEVESGRRGSFVFKHRRADGSEREVEVYSGPIPFREGTALYSIIHDITERKAAQHRLAESQRMLRNVIDSIPVRVFWKDRDSRYLGCNIQFARDAGKQNPDNLLGKDDFQMGWVEQAELYRADDREVMRTGIPKINFEEPQTTPAGDRIWLRTSKIPLRDENGTIYGVLGTYEDITERKRVEEALQESEERFKAITMTASDAILLMDDRGKIVHWNPAAERMFGYSEREAIGKDLHLFLGPKRMHDDFRRGFGNFVRTGQGPVINKAVELVAAKKDGAEFPIEVSTSAMNIAGHWHALGVVRDITERKRGEDALRQSEERFRDLAESLPLTVFEMDLQGRFTYVNRAALEKFGYSRQEFDAGLNMAQMIAPGDRDRAREIMASRLTGNTDGYQEYQGLRKDGTAFPVTVASGPILRDGRPVGLRGIVSDLSERKQLEEELMKSQKLESLGTLAGGIAHDFNNLLQGVFGYISMAKLTHDQREKSLAMLEQAEKALHQSVNLTSQLLTFSKGGKPLKKVIDLRPVIENSVKFALSGSRSTAELQFADDLRLADADAGQIGQVVQNLVLNADQAMPEGGVVRITVGNAPASGLPHGLAAGNHVVISIGDSGVGIAPQYLKKIFDPYFTTKEKGSGLGLATSYSIVKNHGGALEVASEIGKGSTFTVYLPASEQKVAAAAASGPAPLSCALTCRVLVMDDEEMVRKVTYQLLQRLGHEVELAGHGEEAIGKYRQAKAEGRPFDVVILDLTIRGGMGGAETMRKLREIDPGVKAIVSSGYSDDDAVANYREHGFAGFLKKPYDLTGLQTTLSELLR